MNCGRLALAIGALWLSACSKSYQQSALAPASPQARDVLHLFFVFLLVGAVVWLGVAASLGWGLLRRRPPRDEPLDLDARAERRKAVVVGVASAATLVTVLGLSLLSYFAQTRVFARDAPAVDIRITGHQWWWEVEYRGRGVSETFKTANEIHVPVGQIVRVDVDTDNVIHSFWPPSLNGKIDLINGQQNQLEFVAEREGVYRGQCAEFCGDQHAHMGFEVVAETPERFARWRAQQLAEAVTTEGPGPQAFVQRGCALCHTIRGTPAGGRIGPDLTHIGGRRTLAAALLPRNRGNLAAWIADPQHLKPGAEMPSVPLSGSELTTLAAYLDGLK